MMDRVAADLINTGSSERNCEQSVVHITWLDSCDGSTYSCTDCKS